MNNKPDVIEYINKLRAKAIEAKAQPNGLRYSELVYPEAILTLLEYVDHIESMMIDYREKLNDCITDSRD